MTALTPTVRQTARRAVPWIVLASIAVAVALVGILITGGRGAVGIPLDATNAGPAGARAVAQVLRQHGVDVHPVSTLNDAEAAAQGDTTVLVFDTDADLSEGGYARLASVASTLVVVEPTFSALQKLAPGVHAAGAPSGVARAACAVPVARRARSIDPRTTADTKGATTPGTLRAGAGSVGCFPQGSGASSMVRTQFEGRTVYLLGSAAVLMNDSVDRLGNAALALGVLGEHRTLVWYLPSIGDRPVTGPPDMAALTPGWVTPVVILLVLVVIAAAVWRGRRFGPLVVENLPVVVRAGETIQGRARLYQRSSARLRAADSLRIGSIGRLAAAAGLPRAATADQVVDAIAAITGRDRRGLHRLLVDDIPRSDAELVGLSDTLAELERATAAATSPAATAPSAPTAAAPTGRMDP